MKQRSRIKIFSKSIEFKNERRAKLEKIKNYSKKRPGKKLKLLKMKHLKTIAAQKKLQPEQVEMKKMFSKAIILKEVLQMIVLIKMISSKT